MRLIRTMILTTENRLVVNVPLDELKRAEWKWFWVDFTDPTEQEVELLRSFFSFHPLAIEDCIHFLQRPKLDYYDGYTFFVLHAIDQLTLEAKEVDLFFSPEYVVTFHYTKLEEIDTVWERMSASEEKAEKGVAYLVYHIIDKLVDYYFPPLYQLEDRLNALENHSLKRSVSSLMDEVFDIRSDLLKLRQTIVPMRDLLYRILNSDHLENMREQRIYYMDIYDHLLKLTEMIESNREMTADMRDSYLSLNSNRMNSIMVTLTVITTIFMPLTFIAGIYGMNFEYMPELKWRYGYFAVLALMATVGIGMYRWFRRKGWFDRK